MARLADGHVNLVVTSPPYNIGKGYEDKLTLADYLEKQARVVQECVRVLHPQGSNLLAGWQLRRRRRNRALGRRLVPAVPRPRSQAAQPHRVALWTRFALHAAVTRQALPDDRTGGYVEGREQRRRAMACVIVSASLRLPRSHGHDRLGAFQRLNLAFFVDAQNQGSGWWRVTTTALRYATASIFWAFSMTEPIPLPMPNSGINLSRNELVNLSQPESTV